MQLALAFAFVLLAAPADPNPAFETLKSLAGSWTGKAIAGDGPGTDAGTVFKVIAGGTAVQETMFPGTPHEMVNVYHLDGNDVVVTHYCAGGNQPRMKLASSNAGVLDFKFAGGTNIPAKGHYMQAVRITVSDGKLLEEWESVDAGKPVGTARFELARQ